MKLLLLVNPFGSSVTARVRVVIAKALAADHEVTVTETTRRGHASRIARGAAEKGDVDCVVLLGGDGTLNEAANGLAGTRTAIACLPGGSTNVFAQSIGLPNDPTEATGVLLEKLAGPDPFQSIGLGSVNGRYFTFHVGVGFDAAVVEQVERRSSLKRWAGHALFMYAGLTSFFHYYDKSRPRFAVHHADGTVIDDGYFTIIANTNPYTFVGSRPFNISPETNLKTGLTAITLRTMDASKLLPAMGSALFQGERLKTSKWTDYKFDTDHVLITGHGPFPYQVDGDYLGETERLEFRHTPNILRIVM